MEREDGSAGGSRRRQRYEKPDDRTETTPAVLNRVAEGIEALSGAQNQGHRCLPTKAGRSEQYRNSAPSIGDLSIEPMARARPVP